MIIQVVTTHRHIISQEPVRQLPITGVLQLLPKVRRRPEQMQLTVGPAAVLAAVPAEVAAPTAHQAEAVLPTHQAEAVAAGPTVLPAEAVAAGPTVLQAEAAVPAVRVARVVQAHQAAVQEVHLLQGDRLIIK